MARNDTHFEYADKGATSVFKFRVGDDSAWYVWFESDGDGSLFTTPEGGPYRVADPVQSAPFESLDDLLAARGTTKEQWVRDLLAQFGECIGWTYGPVS